MRCVERKHAMNIQDEHVREAALAGVDLNDFCGACWNSALGGHEACSGNSWDPVGTTSKCMCACARAKTLRGES